MNIPKGVCRKRLSVDGVTEHVKKSSQSGFSHRDFYTAPGGNGFHASTKALRSGEHKAAHRVFPDVTGYFHRLDARFCFNRQRFAYFRQPFCKRYVYDRALYSDDFSFHLFSFLTLPVGTRRYFDDLLRNVVLTDVIVLDGKFFK